MSVPTILGFPEPAAVDTADRPLIVLGPSLGTTTRIWDPIAAALADGFRVLRYDLPGHGASPAATRAFSMSDLAGAVLQLAESVDGGPFFYAGDSLGSAIGLTLAAEHPDAVLGLVAFCAGATFGTPDGWRARASLVRASGTSAVVGLSTIRWFAPGYLDREGESASGSRPGAEELARLADVDAESYALCCDALAEYDFGAAAGSMRVRTVCAAGEFDVASLPQEVEALSRLIPGSRYVVVAGAGHLPVLERPVESLEVVRSVLEPGAPA